MRSLVAAVVLVLLVAQGAVAWQTGTTDADISRTVRRLVNAEHRAVCPKALDHTRQLRDVARWKAADMGFHDALSHQDEGGHTVFDFYDTAGINHRYGAGEILGVNTFPVDVSAAMVVEGWMGSPGHRLLIQNCDYDRFGVGVYRTLDRKWYAVEFSNVVRP